MLRSILLFSLVGAATLGSAQSVNGLVVTPTKIVIEGSHRTAQCTLMNTSDTARRYRINLIDMRMSESGALEALSKPDEFTAKDLVRYAPREVTLGPGESQKVRILVNRPASLAAGEYRSHLQFVPTTNDPVAPGRQPTQGIAVGVRIRTSVSIPLIVRNGATEATASLSEFRIVPQGNEWALQGRLGRTGNRSIRGDLTLSFVPSGGGKPTVLGQIRELALYRPNSTRIVQMSIARSSLPTQNGSLRVAYSEEGGQKVTVEVSDPRDRR